MSRLAIHLIILAILLSAADISARRTTRRALNPPLSGVTVSGGMPADTSMIAIGKYDKPLRSRFESVFITNRTDSTVTALSLQLTYTSMQGDTIHQAVRLFNYRLPPRSTRRLTFSSWDKQQTLYYHLTDKPSKLRGTPYNVSITPVEISLSPVN